MKMAKRTLSITLLLCVTFVISFTLHSCKKDEPCTETTWYEDSDGDGFGDAGSSKSACNSPAGYVANNTDFDDSDASAYPGAPEICDDGIDNDGDGFTDCSDFDCDSSTSCKELICDDGIDNDMDGLIDCADSDCETDSACYEYICNDGIDNDMDGFTDCDDSDCAGFPGC